MLGFCLFGFLQLLLKTLQSLKKVYKNKQDMMSN